MDFRQIGKRLSNWGRWGKDDRLGTLNHITPERIAAATRQVKDGRTFDLGLPVSANGIQAGMGGRINPVHTMSMIPSDFCNHPEHAVFADDSIFMPLQSVTQWDGLGHVGYDGTLYNGVPTETVGAMMGSTVLSIDQIAARGIAGRGVLLDIARLHNVARLPVAHTITAADLSAAEARQGVRVGAGDIVIVRTGWLQNFTADGSAAQYWNGEPGLGIDTAEWLHARDVAAVASDNWGIEIVAANKPVEFMPLHCVLIRDMGMTLGEIFVLDALAEDCAQDGVWSFFICAPPLKVVGGVGSPITPIAIK